MARKGTAAASKAPSSDAKFRFIESDSNGTSPTPTTASGSVASRAGTPAQQLDAPKDLDKGELARRLRTLARAPQEPLRQPRQASRAVLPRQPCADALFPPDRADNPHATSQNAIATDAGDTSRTPEHDTHPATSTTRIKEPPSKRPSISPQPHPAAMASSAAYIPPGQQRNMRACMVCSIVRTHQQFLQQGCPNCEDILELINNPEQINDCTSQVFEGLITVADTKRSWVARYQRLEGYVPGVYATQVEGILPDDVLGAVENAGINYVPRDGSEQEMLPKD